MHLTNDGELMTSAGIPPSTVYRITDSISSPVEINPFPTPRPTNTQNAGTIAFVTGRGTQFGDNAHVIVSGKELNRIEDDNA